MPGENLLDAVIVGAGFSGLSILYELRKLGFTCRLFEAGSGLGGIWYWNSYPGARVDSQFYIYQFHQSGIGRGFNWSERYPGWKELQSYFAYVDKEHNFSRDISFNTRVTAGVFDGNTNTWTITTSTGETTKCRHFFLCTGIGTKPYIPEIPGLTSFTGNLYHTGAWTSYGEIDLHGKRVAVIGTGASGVQVTQEVAPIVDHLTVLQRTPNLAVPMQQKKRGDPSWRFPDDSEFDQLLDENIKTFGGVGIDFHSKTCAELSSEERGALFERLYKIGGFAMWMGSYEDIMVNADANQHLYDFWQQKTAHRVHDPVKRDLLVPTIPPHPFGAKRPSLEQSYYEVFNRPNVDLIHLGKNPIKTITSTGILLENGVQVDVDVIVLATGFDISTGGIYQIDIRNDAGLQLRESWKDGIRTVMGIMASSFPNLYFLSGPQATSSFSNGPTMIKIQNDWLIKLVEWMRTNEKSRVVPKITTVEKWVSAMQEAWNSTLFPSTASWYQGANIPGKKVEPLNYAGGLPSYREALAEAASNNYSGFEF